MGMLFVDDKLLKDEIASWSEKDIGVLEVLNFISLPNSPKDGQIEDTYYDIYKHLEIFSDDKKLNDKGLAIIRILQEH